MFDLNIIPLIPLKRKFHFTAPASLAYNRGMFTNILFVILVLILINFTLEIPIQPWIAAPWEGFAAGLALYALILALIYLQNKIFNRKMLILTNLELIIFLCCFIFIFGGQRVLEWPSQALLSLLALSFYLFGLWFFHYTSARGKKWIESPCAEATLEMRMVIPFMLPFLIFTILIDLFSLIPGIEIENEWLASAIIFLVSLLSLAAMMIFFPPVLQWIWQCRPLPKSELSSRLEALCEKAKFRHAGMRTWTVMAYASTAAIIGFVPRFRYVMFTDRLLKELTPESVEAVLAHEIGHSYHRHLILYPFIIFGMLACVSLFSYFCEDALRAYFAPAFSPFLIFAAYALIIALYFRLVFGFFSRQFERQADLHVFQLGVPAEAMKEALLSVARGAGTSPSTPSWHHYSIQERVDFLDRASKDQTLISRHHRRVKIYFTLYLVILAATFGYLMLT